MIRTAVITCGVVLVSLSGAFAQESRSEVSLQGTGFFTSSTSSEASNYSATQTGGFLGTYRYHLNHFVSVEGAYGFDRNSQIYGVTSEVFRIESGIHQFTGAFVFNLPSRAHSKINPYFLAGAGALLFEPSSNQFNSLSGASGQAKGAFVYGAGLNYAIHKGTALRAEYRGLVYSTPDFGFGALATNTVTHTAVPSIGLTFRF